MHAFLAVILQISIDVARIFYGVQLSFSSKVDFLVIVLNIQANLIINISNHPPPSKNFLKITLLTLPGGALSTYPSKFSPWGACATPWGYAYAQLYFPVQSLPLHIG